MVNYCCVYFPVFFLVLYYIMYDVHSTTTYSLALSLLHMCRMYESLSIVSQSVNQCVVSTGGQIERENRCHVSSSQS